MFLLRFLFEYHCIPVEVRGVIYLCQGVVIKTAIEFELLSFCIQTRHKYTDILVLIK